MAILVELVVGILEVLLQFVFEILGYLIWGLLDVLFTKAGGFLGGLLIGIIISIVLYCSLSSTSHAFWWSCGAMVGGIGLGVLVEAARESK